MNNTPLLIIVSASVLCTAAIPTNAQSTPKGLIKTAEYIRTTNPKVTEALLNSDISIIQSSSSFKAVKSKLSTKGFSDKEIEQAVVVAWVELRKPSGTLEPLTTSLVAAAATKLGRQEIASDPGGAEISIDGERVSDPTNTAQWLVVGSHKIRLTLDGYFPEEDAITIAEGKNKAFFKKLKKRPQYEIVPTAKDKSKPSPDDAKKPRSIVH